MREVNGALLLYLTVMPHYCTGIITAHEHMRSI